MNSPNPATECIFCRIARGEIAADIVGRAEGAVAFRDLNPQAPVHILVIPTRHLASAAETAGEGGGEAWSAVMRLAVQVAGDEGLAATGFRFVVNTGRDGGQSVDHLHVHLLGGRQMRWPPG